MINKMNLVLRKVKLSQVVLIIVLLIVGVLMLLPFFWAFATSLRLPRYSFDLPPSFFPTDWRWDNYVHVFTAMPFAQFFKNSIIVVFTIVLVQTLFTSMAAFAFAKLKFKGRDFFFFYIICGLMIPFQSIAIAQFLIVNQMNLVNTRWALILPFIANPFGVFLMRQFMIGIPDSYYDAAVIDGCNKIRIYWNIMLPMSVPSLVVVAFIRFIEQWNNFFAPLIYISSTHLFTLPLGMQALRGFRSAGNLAHIMAGVMISLTVPAIVYIVGQKHLMKGTLLSGLKS